MKQRNEGYSAFELIIALVVISLVLYFSVSYSNKLLAQISGQSVSQQAYDYSQEMIRYISSHQNQLRELLSQNNSSNGKIITVTPQVLKNEGFIRGNIYFKNKLNQYPCTIIWYDHHQLQALVYYRDDKNAKSLDNYQWIYGLNHIGAMIGLYKDGQILGAAKDWTLDNNFINQMFVKLGSADMSQGSNPGLYSCDGLQISEPSYVVNITSMLSLPQALPKDDTIHQYSDFLNDVDAPENNNRMNTDINLDDSNNLAQGSRKSNIIFQMNPNCVMDPNKFATMYDYDATYSTNDYTKRVNSTLGCKNRQLAIQSTTDPVDNSQAMIVTGFNQGGNPQDFGDNRPFVGEVNAASIQPSTQIPVGSVCQSRDVGTIAQQQKSADPNDVNNIYVSQVICMKSPLCAGDGYCYMPVQNVTIQYKPNTASFTCPAGTFIDTSSVQESRINIEGKITCHSTGGDCSARIVNWGKYVYSPSDGIAKSLTIAPTQWYQGCPTIHLGCNEGWGNIANTQDTISSINCTNDPSKAPIIVNKY